ncbi:hypothetical protein [Alcaligenes faecalis]|uniref:hypothetical protein n=1 Tax=Alcaligenes faecalis TaxID=511 RepID=UPI0029338CE2|nr:hypothetical protein [Alcaligenes faecalis]MDV2116491.1 hypothetical protein [Alcaligenes faecalis]
MKPQTNFSFTPVPACSGACTVLLMETFGPDALPTALGAQHDFGFPATHATCSTRRTGHD